MSFVDAAVLLDDKVYEAFGIAALWTPTGALSALPVTLLATTPEEIGPIAGIGSKALQRNAYTLRVSEALLMSPGQAPQRGDVVALPNGKVLKITTPPTREDEEQLEWTLVLG